MMALIHIARQCVTAGGWKVTSEAHAFCVRYASTARGCLLSFLVDPAEVLTLSLHNSRVRDTRLVSAPGDKKRPQVNRLHHTSIMGAQGQAAVSTSLFCAAAGRPLLLTFSPPFIFPNTAAEGPVESGSTAQPSEERNRRMEMEQRWQE